jgi:hypothetical protein
MGEFNVAAVVAAGGDKFLGRRQTTKKCSSS